MRERLFKRFLQDRSEVTMDERNKIEFEYIFVCSMPMLYGFLTTPEGLQSWFCDHVIIEEKLYTFSWEGEKEKANCLKNSLLTEIKYEWLNRPTPEFTQFTISKSPITRETILQITTFCSKNEEEEEQILWDNAIGELKHATGG